MPNGSNRVDDVFSFQVAARGYDCFSRWQAVRPLFSAYSFALLKYSWSAFAMDGAVDASASHQRGVCRVHDGVCYYFGDVALDEANCCALNLELVFCQFFHLPT